MGPASNDRVIIDWIRRDTTFSESCDQPNWLWGRADIFMASANSVSGTAASSPIGSGGSMARFTIVNERLYTVSLSSLEVFNISNAGDPHPANTIHIGWNIETIYPFKNKLFIGSRDGMFIYNVTNADAPVAAGQFNHARSCDPVIADDEYAYVTLRSGTTCEGFSNQLDIVKLSNTTDPVLLKTYPMKNPHGLSMDGNLLFICDGAAGLKVYDAADVLNLKQLNEINGMNTYDVIAMNKIALVVAKDGLYQYSYSDPKNMHLLSKITVNK